MSQLIQKPISRVIGLINKHGSIQVWLIAKALGIGEQEVIDEVESNGKLFSMKLIEVRGQMWVEAHIRRRSSYCGQGITQRLSMRESVKPVRTLSARGVSDGS